MNKVRIKQLQEFLQETPNDPFLIYALATEYKEADAAKAKTYFDALLTDHPNYIGTYYHAAALYADHFDRQIADKIYQKGIQIAANQANYNALRELQNAYTNFQFEED